MKEVVIRKNLKYWQRQAFSGHDVWGDKNTAFSMPKAKADERIKRIQRSYDTPLKTEACL